MSYLLDKKNKRKNLNKIIIMIIVLFFLGFFRVSIFNGFSYLAHQISRPFLILGNSIGNKTSNISSYFSFKKNLYQENEYLKNQLNEMNARVSNYSSVLDKSIKLEEVLGKKKTNRDMIQGGILSKSSNSVYGSLIIDIGKNQSVEIGQRVFAYGYVPIGKVAEVYPKSSKVILYSSPLENTEVVISGKDIFMEVVGRGSGNFEMILPRDFVLDIGTEVDLPGSENYILGYVASIISDPRDSFQKALLRSPVNIFELKFVEVEK